jgi:hypothetical protein
MKIDSISSKYEFVITQEGGCLLVITYIAASSLLFVRMIHHIHGKIIMIYPSYEIKMKDQNLKLRNLYKYAKYLRL